MHAVIKLSVAFTLIASTHANKLLTAIPRDDAKGLFTRQSQAFEPGSSSGFGETCAEAFGAGYLSCGTGSHCYNPDAGESCCQPSAPYACPSASFCLINNFCCPSGLDATTCANQNNVSLPPNFNTSPVLAPATTSPPSISAVASTAVVPTAAAAAPAASSGFPIPKPANGSSVVSYTPYNPTVGVKPYTGGAADRFITSSSLSTVVIAAVVVGLAL